MIAATPQQISTPLRKLTSKDGLFPSFYTAPSRSHPLLLMKQVTNRAEGRSV